MAKTITLQLIIITFVLGTAGAQEPDPGLAVMSPEDFNVLRILTAYRVCSARIAGFEATTGVGYQKWTADNAEKITRVESMPWASQRLATIDETSVSANGESAPIPKECGRLEEILLEQGLPVDTRLSSPEATWKIWLAALLSGDREAALRCLTGRARRVYREVIETADAETLKAMGADVESMTPTGEQYGPFQEGVIRLKNGNGGFVTFILRDRGEWKIQDMGKTHASLPN